MRSALNLMPIGAEDQPRPHPGPLVEAQRSIYRMVAETAAASCARSFEGDLRALILTGSMSRQEANVQPEAGNWKVAGDAEFLLVLKDSRKLPPGSDTASLARQIQESLSARGVICPISLSCSHADYLRRMRPHIYAYEMRHTGVVVTGDPDILQLIADYPANAIPRFDAWCLLSNRMIELIETAAMYGTDHGQIAPELAYSTVKLAVDMAASLLVFAGRFASGYQARRRTFGQLAREDRGSGSFDRLAIDWDATSDLVGVATDCKLGKRDLQGAVREPFWGAVHRTAFVVWAWQLAQLNGDVSAGDWNLDWRKFSASQKIAQRVRGWAYVARQQQWLRSVWKWPRWGWMALQASPRMWIYRSAALLYLNFPTTRQPAQNSAGAPVFSRYHSRETRRLPVCVLDLRSSSSWIGAARSMAWNYHAFAEKTR